MPKVMLALVIIIGAFAVPGRATEISVANLESKYPQRVFQYAQLPSGKTHFQLVGEGPLVVLIHGVSGPMAVWDKNVASLVDSGYQVLRYDLFGRGFSDRPVGASFSLLTYVRQLEELLVHLNLENKLTIIGSSFGSIIGTEFAFQHPQKINQLVLIGPAGFPIQTPLLSHLRDVPVVGDWATQAFGFPTILKQNDKYFVSERMPEDLRNYFIDQLSVKRSAQAIDSTMNNSPVQSAVPLYKTLGTFQFPVDLIWGREDVTFPYSNSKTLLEAVPRARLITIEDSAHLPQYERADEVNSHLQNILGRASEFIEATPRITFPPAINETLSSQHIDNFEKFTAPFFQNIFLEKKNLELSPGVRKTYQFPTLYAQMTVATSIHLADFDAAAKKLPAGLYPVSFGFGRTAVVLSSYRYQQVNGMLPYNEVAIGIFVTTSTSKIQQLTSLLSLTSNPQVHIISMPVTTRENQIRGEKIWGLPKIVRAIDLRQVGEDYTTTVYDDKGSPYLELTIPTKGIEKLVQQTGTLVSLLDGEFQKSVSRSEGVFQVNSNPEVLAASCERKEYISILGTSQVAQDLRDLRIDPTPLRTQFGTNVSGTFSLPD